MSVSPTKEELEKNIEELTNEYNSNVEKLVLLEVALNDAKDASHTLLKRLYEQRKFSSFSSREELNKLENEYEDTNSKVVEKQSDCFKKQSLCFKQLQSLRQLQHTYLVGIINGLQKELAAIKAAQDTEDVTQSIRSNNL